MESVSRSEEIVDAHEQLAPLSQFYRALNQRDINANAWPRTEAARRETSDKR